jgi:hypothetical protein
MQGSSKGGSNAGYSGGRSAILGSVVGIGSAVAAAGGPSGAFTAPSFGNYSIIGIETPRAQRAIAIANDRGNARRGRT